MAIDANTLLLMHMEGADNGVVFTEESGKTIGVNGQVKTSIAQKKFGTSSALFDGSGDYLSTPALVIGTGAFTIDFWFYRTGNYGGIFSWGGSNASPTAGLIIVCHRSGYGSSGIYASGWRIQAAATTDNAWHHCAVVGNGGATGSRNIKMYIDGALIGTWTVDYNYSNLAYIGANQSSTSECTNGYMDEVRVSNIQRWASAFTPPTDSYIARKMKALVVAGGGGGGAEIGGGGGGGGVIYHQLLDVPLGQYAITIGNGGNGFGATCDGYSDKRGYNGENSSFDTLVAIGGGGGGCNNANTYGGGKSGGSGGGEAQNPYGIGSGTTGQGNSGGYASNSAGAYGSGGGGGAGAVGGNGSSSAGGNGGAGLACDISGSTNYYGAGGGGAVVAGTIGVGGSSIGGSGASLSPIVNATPGVANTGSGGGGNNQTSSAGAGGSGIVIIRYKTSEWGICTGGTKTTDGEYTIHTFTSSGTFNVSDTNNYASSGTALFGPFVIPQMIADPESSIVNWTEIVPAGTEILVKAAIVDTIPEESDFIEVTNGGIIPGLSQSSSGKNLYFKAYLSTTDSEQTPEFSALGYGITEQPDPYKIKISLTYAGRLKHPQGEVNILYTNGLTGPGPSPVASFNQGFIPIVNPLWFKPNDPEYLTVNANATINAFDVIYGNAKNADEYIKYGAYNASISTTNVGGVPL